MSKKTRAGAPPLGSELVWLTIVDAARLLREGQIKPSELLEAQLEHVALVEPRVHAFSHLAVEFAKKQARKADADFETGVIRGPLHGIPYSVKGFISVAGMPMAMGSRLGANWWPEEDAVIVRLMQEAGAVCLGKAVSHEFGWGVISPPARNAWDNRAIAGGSSGGSAVSVAAGEAFFSWGTDCGTSIRTPAALNGCVGMRVTQGLVPQSGVLPMSATLDTTGPLARSVEDLALVLNAGARYDPLDHSSVDARRTDYRAGIRSGVRGLRLGVPSQDYFDHMELGVRRTVEAAIGTLEELGAQVREVCLPRAGLSRGTFRQIAMSESAAFQDEWMEQRASELGTDTRAIIETGNLLLAKDYVRASQVRTLIRNEVLGVLDEVDVIITPAAPATAKPATTDGLPTIIEYPDGYTEVVNRAYGRFTNMFSLAGTPSCVVPCGFGEDGLPTGVHITAKPFAETMALRVAYAYEQATNWGKFRPPMHSSTE